MLKKLSNSLKGLVYQSFLRYVSHGHSQFTIAKTKICYQVKQYDKCDQSGSSCVAPTVQDLTTCFFILEFWGMRAFP